MCAVTVGYTAVTEAAVKTGNGKGQHNRKSPDIPVRSVTPRNASPSGVSKGKEGRFCLGQVEQNRREYWQVAELKLKL